MHQNSAAHKSQALLRAGDIQDLKISLETQTSATGSSSSTVDGKTCMADCSSVSTKVTKKPLRSSLRKSTQSKINYRQAIKLKQHGKSSGQIKELTDNLKKSSSCFELLKQQSEPLERSATDDVPIEILTESPTKNLSKPARTIKPTKMSRLSKQLEIDMTEQVTSYKRLNRTPKQTTTSTSHNNSIIGRNKSQSKTTNITCKTTTRKNTSAIKRSKTAPTLTSSDAELSDNFCRFLTSEIIELSSDD